MKDHDEPLQDINLVPAFEEIGVEYDPGTTVEVTMHDGSRLRLRKLEEDYDPPDKVQSIKRLMEAHEKGEILTGVFYVNTQAPNFIETLNMTEHPLTTLPESAVPPSRGGSRQGMEGVGEEKPTTPSSSGKPGGGRPRRA